jgi:hypothetical protein
MRAVRSSRCITTPPILRHFPPKALQQILQFLLQNKSSKTPAAPRVNRKHNGFWTSLTLNCAFASIVIMVSRAS